MISILIACQILSIPSLIVSNFVTKIAVSDDFFDKYTDFKNKFGQPATLYSATREGTVLVIRKSDYSEDIREIIKNAISIPRYPFNRIIQKTHNK